MPEPLTEAQLAEIEARCAAATPGPYCTDRHWVRGPHGASVARADGTKPEGGWDEGQALRDAAFFAAARTDVPALVAEVRRMRAELDSCVQSHQRINGEYEEALILLLDLRATHRHGQVVSTADWQRVDTFLDA